MVSLFPSFPDQPAVGSDIPPNISVKKSPNPASISRSMGHFSRAALAIQESPEMGLWISIWTLWDYIQI